jgi:hypothetical protein
LAEHDAAFLEIDEMASDETIEIGRIEHPLDHFDGVVARIEQRDYVLGGFRGGCHGSRVKSLKPIQHRRVCSASAVRY